jgi:sphinganine-1-phosphate aldolase
MRTLPSAGWTQDQIDRGLAAFVDIDPPRDRTRLSIGVLYVSDEIQRVLQRAHNLFAPHNAALSPRPGTREMQDEVIAIADELLSGGRSGTETTMSGSGTESGFNALHAARAWARATKPHITRPKVVASMAAHGAFTKVCRYLDLELVRAPLGPDLRIDTDAVAALVDHDTIAVLASAPDWPFGYFDDIPSLGRLAIRHDLWLHVDATVGGFVAPFAAAVGEQIPPWDLSVPGVTSLAADLGTWAYGMKSASVVVWCDREHQAYSTVEVDDWPIRRYETVGFAGSRSAGPVAAAWAVLHHLGRDGYELLARHLMEGKRIYAERLALLPGVELIEPGLVNLNFRHRTMPVETIVACMADRGWTHYTCDDPELVSIYLDASAIDVMDDYVADLADVLRAGRACRPSGRDGRAIVA